MSGLRASLLAWPFHSWHWLPTPRSRLFPLLDGTSTSREHRTRAERVKPERRGAITLPRESDAGSATHERFRPSRLAAGALWLGWHRIRCARYPYEHYGWKRRRDPAPAHGEGCR